MSNKANVTEQVVESMRKKILSGEWEIGKKIPSESELCKTYDCSRTSVRSAIQKFNALGVLETRRGSGTVVISVFPLILPDEIQEQTEQKTETDLSEKALWEWRQARYILEPKIAEEAALIATEEQVAMLKQINQEQYDCIGKPQEFIDKDREFHLMIASFLGNELITGMMQNLLNQNELMKICNDKFGYTGAGYFHMMIADAIEQHDAQRARVLMEDHLAEVNNYFGLKRSN